MRVSLGLLAVVATQAPAGVAPLRADTAVFKMGAFANVAAPSLTRIVIDPSGALQFEGQGTPGSSVTVHSAGRALAGAVVAPSGAWQLVIQARLSAGDHRFETAALSADRRRTLAGQDVRISIPRQLSGVAIVALQDNAQTAQAPAESGDSGPGASAWSRHAEELAVAASELFSTIMAETKNVRYAQAPSQEPAPEQKQPAVPLSDEDVLAPVEKWLERSAQDYQGVVIRRLSTPGGEATRVAPAPPVTPLSAADLSASEKPVKVAPQTLRDVIQEWLARANREYQDSIVKRLTEPPATHAPEGFAASASPAPQAVHGDHDETRLEDQRSFDQTRGAEDAAQKAAEASKAVEEAARRKAEDEAKRIEEERRARKIEEDKRIAEQKKAIEEASRKSAEEKRLARQRRTQERKAAEEAARKAAEEKRASEERLVAERRAAEERRLGDERLAEQKKAEERRLAEQRRAEEKKAAEEETQKAAEEKRSADQRLPGEQRARDEIAKKAAEDVENGSADGVPNEVGETKPTEEPQPGARSKEPAGAVPSRQAFEETGRASVAARRHATKRVASKPARGRARAAKPRRVKVSRRITRPRIYVVKRGDSLWKIARMHYKLGSRYPVLVKANRSKIKNPNLIFPGQRLYIPTRRR